MTPTPLRLALLGAALLPLATTAACVGPAGPSTLVRATPEAAGANCPLGGVRLDMGLDRNGDRVLEPREVTSTEYVCNVQADGLTSLVRVDPVAPGGACGTASGSRVVSGLDANDDGVLDPSEVQTQNVICDGEDGANGANGADGADGLSSLLRVEPLAPDPDGACYFGGVLIKSGLDLDGDGVLQPGEVDEEAAVCAVHVNENLTLIEQSLELPGPNCEHGGIRTVVGYDADGDGVLDPEEAGPPGYACNQMTVIDGVSTLLDVADATGNQCAYGGYVLRSGADTDRDGVLDATEVQDTAVVCNGHDGVTTLVKMAPASLAQCEVGGHVVTSGLDLDGDGVLDPSEVQATGLVCNGKDGFLGYDGLNSLVRIRGDGGACGPVGGFILEVGLDANEDGVLSPSEVEDWEVVCNGYDGYDSLVAMWEDTEVCVYSGVLVESGRDLNFDGVLQLSEVEHQAWLCDGWDGYTSLVDFEDAGFDCPGDGFYILSGLDLDFDGYLDFDEVENEVLVCL